MREIGGLVDNGTSRYIGGMTSPWDYLIDSWQPSNSEATQLQLRSPGATNVLIMVYVVDEGYLVAPVGHHPLQLRRLHMWLSKLGFKTTTTTRAQRLRYGTTEMSRDDSFIVLIGD